MMSDEMLGSIKLFAGDWEPQYWRFCNGQSVKQKDFVALASVLGIHLPEGVEYEDLEGEFNLPNLESPQEGLNYIICINGHYPARR